MNPHLEHRHLFHRVYPSLSVRPSRRILLDSLLLQSVDPHDPMIGWREIDVATRSDLFGLCDLILSTWILWTQGGRGDSEARDDEARSLVAPTPSTPRSLAGVSSGRHRRVIRYREPRLPRGGGNIPELRRTRRDTRPGRASMCIHPPIPTSTTWRSTRAVPVIESMRQQIVTLAGTLRAKLRISARIVLKE